MDVEQNAATEGLHVDVARVRYGSARCRDSRRMERRIQRGQGARPTTPSADERICQRVSLIAHCTAGPFADAAGPAMADRFLPVEREPAVKYGFTWCPAGRLSSGATGGWQVSEQQT